MKKIIDIGEISLKEKIALGIVCIILLSIGTSIISNIGKKDNNIDYKNFNIDDILVYSTETKTREEYWILSDIIYSFLSSYNKEIGSNGILNSEQGSIYTRESYYKVLSSSYRKYLSKSKYMDLSKTMMEKFISYKDNKKQIKTENLIEKIYILDDFKYEKNMYLCKLKPEKSDVTSYIGIQLLENNSYNIFYIY